MALGSNLFFILDFAHIEQKFPSDHVFFPWKRRNIYTVTQLIVDWRLLIADWNIKNL